LYVAVMVAGVDAVTTEVLIVTLAVTRPAATVTVAGTGKALLLLESATVIPPVGAALPRVTVRVAFAPPLTLVGETETEVRAAGTTGTIVTLAVFVPPLYMAVIIEGVEAATVAVCTVTLAVLAPAGTMMWAETGNAVLVLERVTVAPPAGAAPLRATARMALAPPVTVAGVTETSVNVGNTTGAMATVVVFVAPLYVAVTVIGVEAVTVPATTFRLALKSPAGTEMLAGRGKAEMPPERVTVKPPAGAAVVRAIVSVTVPPGATWDGLAEMELKAAGADLIRDQLVARESALTEPRPVT